MSKKTQPQTNELPFVSHLFELRDRMIRVLISVCVVFLCLFPFANELYTYLAEPLMVHLPESSTMIATDVTSPFLTPFKFTLVLSFFISIPVVLYQAWSFVAPGLYKNEKKLVFPLLISSVILFYAGMAFAYYVVFPLVFGFLTSVAPDGVSVMTDIARYLDFVLKMFFAFGVAFEVPIATILLVWTGVTTPESLAQKRPYIIVSIFVIGMLLTPPDVISQTLLAIPMWILFELGIVFSRFFVNKDEDSDEDTEEETNPSDDYDINSETNGNYEPHSTDDSINEKINENADEDIDEDEHLRESDHEPMSEAEMDAELDRIEADEADEADEAKDKKDKNT